MSTPPKKRGRRGQAGTSNIMNQPELKVEEKQSDVQIEVQVETEVVETVETTFITTDTTANEDFTAAEEVDQISAELFQCVVCRKGFSGQMEFFVHLKSHYEPVPSAAVQSGATVLPQTTAESQKKKPGRKRKPLAQKSASVNETDDPIVPESVVVQVGKKTRCGRISKPRPRDSDMVYLSPTLKVEPKTEPPDIQDEYIGVEVDEQQVMTTHVAIADDSADIENDEDQDAEFKTPQKPVAKSDKLAQQVKKPRGPRKPRDGTINFKKVSTDGGVYKYECEVCHKLYANTTSMSVHMRIHKGEKPFSCKECDRSFRQYSDLNYHIASIHSDIKAFQCEYCGKEFSRKYSLTIHHKIHTGVRDYKCEVCQRGFRAAIYLQEHRRIHTGEKPFLCDVCGRGFRIKSDMLRHRLNVHFKGKATVIIKTDGDEILSDEVEGKEVVAIGGDEDEEGTHFVTITTKSDDDDGEMNDEEGGSTQTMHRLVFISENEAILV